MKTLVRVALILSLSIGILIIGYGTAESQKPAQKAKYEEIEVVNGGAIVGQVTWVGDIPEVQQLQITKNPEVCDVAGKGTKPSPRLMVSAENKGVKNTVVYLADIEKGKKLEELLKVQLKPDQKNLHLDQKQCVYEPHIIIAPVRTKLDMVSNDDLLHNIHMHGAARYNLAFPIKDKVITKRLRKAGLVKVVCDAGHSWMSAYIHVVKHPYYAVTDKNGNFKIADVPPGKYKLHAWHEGWNIVKTEKQGDLISYVFSESLILKKDVTVTEKKEIKVNFELSDKLGSKKAETP